MEGILGVLRKKGREEAQALGVPFSMPKETVPDHPDISKDLRYLVGKQSKIFMTTFCRSRTATPLPIFWCRKA